MLDGKYVLAQLMEWLPRGDFERCVRRYQGNHRVRTFSCRDQFLCMAFAQLTGRDSLRETVCCLDALQPRLYHAGIRGNVSRSTLADANQSRDWRIWSDLASTLIARARRLHADVAIGIDLKATAYVLDATVIELCLSLFPWALAQRQSGGIKAHVLMDLRGNIPCFVRVSSARTPDVTTLDHLIIEPGAYYIMDRGYNDYARLHRIEQAKGNFIVRARIDMKTKRRSSRVVDKVAGLRSDQTVVFRDRRTVKKYPLPLRRITYRDVEQHQRFIFMTNDFQLPALTVTQLYHSRWQIELLFKWLKQHLRIQHFFGNTVNAVQTQIWIAVCVYVLIAIIRHDLKIERSMSQILHIASLTLFEKTPIKQVFSHQPSPTGEPCGRKQLLLFDF